MRVLGRPLTWLTTCFVNPACNETVWAHTNGDGDFVLFDSLGPPWPIHFCYLNRFCFASSTTGISWEIRGDRESDYRLSDDPGRNIVVEPLREIRRISAEDMLDEGELRVLGYVQAYLENRVEHLARNLGGIGRQHLFSALGGRRS